MDDISLTASSKSFKKNIQILEREASELIALGNKNYIEFDIIKTELIHFHISPKLTLPLKLPNGVVVQPKRVIKWLGIHFDSNLKFKEHIAIRTSLAKQAFYRLNRLVNIARGLSPFAVRQLYLACVTSVSDYGSVLWWGKINKTQIRPLQAIQNLATKKILGVFKTAPIAPRELESTLLPPIIRLNHSQRRYVFRVLKLGLNHPIRAEFNKITSCEPELDSLSDSSNNTSELNQLKNQTQIQRLIGSIRNLVDLETLEPIKHFYFAPWERELPYSVKISLNSKEEEAKLHKQYLNNIVCSNIKTIYTDGSQTPDGLGIGLGFVVFDNTDFYIPTIPTYSYKENIGSSAIVYNGELEGITKALEVTSRTAEKGVKYIVYSDNQAGLYRLMTPSDKPGQSQQIRAIVATKAILAKGASVELVWVPGHKNILGNEIADKLAKQATFEPIYKSETTSFAFLGIEINKVKTQEIYNYLLSQKPSQHPGSYCNIY